MVIQHTEPPDLETLGTKPSWVNRAGRVDRSACLEVAAGEVWRFVAWEMTPEGELESPAGRLGMSIRHPTVPVRRSMLNAAPTRRRGKEKSFTVTLTAHDVVKLLESRRPRRLAGDFRTGKANALRPTPGSADDVVRQERLKKRVRASWSPREEKEGGGQKAEGGEKKGAGKARRGEGGVLLDVGLPANPNAGVCRSKTAGLTGDWRQTLRVERFRWTERMVQHFLICPRCRKKKVKLFMPLVTAGELRDAWIAAVWLRAPGNGPGTAAEARVVERYGPLLEKRELRCAACWGLRYGEAKRSTGD